MYDIRPLVDAALATVHAHQCAAPGAYRRWNWPRADGVERDLGVTAYGCADAANILYTLGHFPAPRERAAWVTHLRALQDEASGLFYEATHHPIHTTAHCIAALELFDACPQYPLTALAQVLDQQGLQTFLADLDWRHDPWSMSHRGAGIYAALRLTGEGSREWEDWYFAWLWEEADPVTGFWRRGCVEADGSASLFHHLAGSFHYLFNHEYARRPLRYPERMIDTCLRIWEERRWPALAQNISFAEIDWIYCLTRSLRQCGYRFQDCRQALEGFAQRYLPYLGAIDYARDEGWNDLHLLFGALCAVAELQQARPGLLHSERPLTLVLDRRPFI